MSSIGILHLIDLDILVIDRNIVELDEFKTIEPVRKAEYGIDTVLESEIRLELLRIKRILSFLITL